MSVKRVLRFLAGLIVASLLLWFILPLCGIASSKFLPPGVVYNNATGVAHGVVISKNQSPTGNPFNVGDHVYQVIYAFRAPPPLLKGQTKPGPTVRYYGTARTDGPTFDAVKEDDVIPRIKYEKTYPDINGIDAPNGGRSIGPGSNILSGWLLFVLLDVVLAYGFMVILEQFTDKENI